MKLRTALGVLVGGALLVGTPVLAAVFGAPASATVSASSSMAYPAGLSPANATQSCTEGTAAPGASGQQEVPNCTFTMTQAAPTVPAGAASLPTAADPWCADLLTRQASPGWSDIAAGSGQPSPLEACWPTQAQRDAWVATTAP